LLVGRTADVNVVDNEGNISLMFVIQYGTLPIIKAFIEHKAKLDAKKNKKWASHYHYNNRVSVNYLNQLGAKY
jgi:ankyrin repeat protein